MSLNALMVGLGVGVGASKTYQTAFYFKKKLLCCRGLIWVAEDNFLNYGF